MNIDYENNQMDTCSKFKNRQNRVALSGLKIALLVVKLRLWQSWDGVCHYLCSFLFPSSNILSCI